MGPHQALDETICAVATPMGEGGIGVIRISGSQALRVAAQVVKLRSGSALDRTRSHTLYLADVFTKTQGRKGSHGGKRVLVDEALVVVMRSPRSYTGEDVVEIHTHGGPLILQATCQELIESGARLAEPGEFTKRAFLNGRLDLTQAEAVLDTICATTSSSLTAAQDQLRGTLSKEVNRLRDNLIRILAQLEAGMDFVEEDISFIQLEEVIKELHRVRKDLHRLISTYSEGRIIREGIKVAIIGRPNVGKSSILNALLRTDRAIVSPIPGTTRDVLDEVLNIRGVSVRLVDTAGLRDTKDLLEEEGIRRTQEAIDQAEVVLLVLDGSAPLSEEDRQLLLQYGQGKSLAVLNKSDLPPKIFGSEVSQLLSDNQILNAKKNVPLIVCTSAQTGAGMEDLRDGIRNQVLRADFEPGESVLVTHLRHQSALQRAKESIEQALGSAEGRLAGEIIAVDLRGGLDCLGEITGEVTNEDILDRIFKDFCIGK